MKDKQVNRLLNNNQYSGLTDKDKIIKDKFILK